jgi:tRNA-splicing ligase RtcB
MLVMSNIIRAWRAPSRHEARRQWQGCALIDQLRAQGIVVRSHSARGVAEGARGAYKDVGAVVAAAKRARPRPPGRPPQALISVKGLSP